MKRGDSSNWYSSALQHPFSLRKGNLFDFYTYEEVILKKSYDLSLRVPPKTILDGGGNIGLTAAFFATKYPGAAVATLEPEGDNFELLKKNTSAYKNIYPIRAGVWPRTAQLVVKDTGLGNNGFTVEETDVASPQAVPALSIAAVMRQMNWSSIDLLKLDVEGSEKDIFASGHEDWLPYVKTAVVEIHDRMKKGCSRAVFSTLLRYNFSFEVAGENVVFTNEEPKEKN